jgi:mRNA-degrading endonuclease RelE of RelBE toxin-antitoxin system
MRFEFKPSFDRSIKQLPQRDKEGIKTAAIQLVDILSHDRYIYKGIGLKRLRGNFWEARKGIKVRILFRWEGALVEFVLAGNHDDIKKFLKNA